MDWLKSILESHIGEDGKLDLESAIKDINKKAPENVVPKEQYNSMSESKKKLEADVKARDKQLEDLKKAGSVEDLQKKLTEAQEANEKAKKEYDDKIVNLTYDTAIEKALASAVHPDLMSLKIDRSKLKLKEDGSIDGLEEQVKSLKDTYKDMFKPDKSGNKLPNPEGKPFGITKEQFSKMKYAERLQLFNENKELYDQLAGGKENG